MGIDVDDRLAGGGMEEPFIHRLTPPPPPSPPPPPPRSPTSVHDVDDRLAKGGMEEEGGGETIRRFDRVATCDMMRADDFLRKMTMARRSDAFLALGEDYVVVDPLRLPPSSAAIAAETVGKDADCDDASCLGVWDGLLVDCPHPPKGGGGLGWRGMRLVAG